MGACSAGQLIQPPALIRQPLRRERAAFACAMTEEQQVIACVQRREAEFGRFGLSVMALRRITPSLIC